MKIITFLLFMTVFTSCINNSKEYIDPRGIEYAGSASCIQCHQTIYNSSLHSAHYNASALASSKNILGSLKKGHNTFVYDKDTKLVIESRDSGLYQVLYKKGSEKEAHRFDITFGFRNAQTWLYWQNNNAYELPISYYSSVNNWATSPNFSSETPDFQRLVGKDCFECHSSNISSKNNTEQPVDNYFATAVEAEVLEKKSVVYGIDCERCHGPAANHVNYHLKFPKEKIAKHIVLIASLNKQQKLDMCAVCHSGNDKIKVKSRFKFKPGDTLSNFFMNVSNHNATDDIDVHGNQFGLLSQSKCFIESKTMDCITCHNPHKGSNQNHTSYSKICLSCHSSIAHNKNTMQSFLGKSLKDNCIDCHMPRKASKAISFHLSGSSKNSSYLLRTHKIGIYSLEKSQ